MSLDFVILFCFSKAIIIDVIYLYFGTSFPKPLINSYCPGPGAFLAKDKPSL
jgi:hypothetical protein